MWGRWELLRVVVQRFRFEASQLVGIEETDLPGGDFLDDGPVVSHGTAQADEDGALAAGFKKAGHFGPEFIEGGCWAGFCRACYGRESGHRPHGEKCRRW